jgi:D-sedoheptulose 7-phosphate isomerase
MTDAAAYTANYLAASRTALDAFIADSPARAAMLGMAEDIAASMQAGGKYLLCGNGGSAADSQHIAGEFISRLMFDHPALPAVALTTDSSSITATGNDYGYEHIFARQVTGLGRPGDVLLAISTSGNSPNVLAAIATAKAQGMTVHGFTGGTGGRMAALCDRVLIAPSPWTPVIQQIHITAAHIVCALVERAMFPDLAPPIA